MLEEKLTAINEFAPGNFHLNGNIICVIHRPLPLQKKNKKPNNILYTVM